MIRLLLCVRFRPRACIVAWILGCALGATPHLPAHAESAASGDSSEILLGSPHFRSRGWLRRIAFTADGSSLIAAPLNGGLIRWDVSTGRLAQTYSFVREAFSLSPDGKRAAAITMGQTIQILDLKTGEVERDFGNRSGEAGTLEWSSCGKFLAVSMLRDEIVVWKSEAAEQIGTFPCARESQIRWARGRPRLAYATPGNRDLAVVDLPSMQRVAALPITPPDDPRFDLSPDGNVVVVCFTDRPGFAFDLARNCRLPEISAMLPAAMDLKFSPDGNLLAVSEASRTSLLDMKTLTTVPIGPGARVRDAVAFSSDSKTLAIVRPSGARLWNLDGNVERFPSAFDAQSVSALAWSRDAGTIFAAAEDGGVVAWQTTGDGLRIRSAHAGSPHALRLSADGARLFVDAYEAPVVAIDPSSGAQLFQSPMPTAGYARSVLMDHDDAILVVERTGAVKYRLGDGEHPARSLPHESAIAVLVNSDSTRAATIARHEAVLWDLGEWSEISRLSLRQKSRGAMAGWFGPAGHPSEEPLCMLFETTSGVELWNATADRDIWVAGVRRNLQTDLTYQKAELSPDRRWIAFPARSAAETDYDVHVLEAESGTVVFSRTLPDASADSLAFSPDSLSLAIGLSTGQVLVCTPLAMRTERPADDISVEESLAALDSPDGQMARKAIRSLARGGPKAVSGTARLLERVPDADVCSAHIAALSSGDPAERERAATSLLDLGINAEPALGQAAASSPDPEVAERCRSLLSEVGLPRASARSTLRLVRGIAALEYNGTPEARASLEKIAQNHFSARGRREALRALARLRGVR